MNNKSKIKLFAKNPIKHGGKRIHEKEFSVDDKRTARELIECGSAVDVDGYFDSAAETVTQNDNTSGSESIADDRIELIKSAITKLEPDNKKHWTEDGKPDAKALSKVAGAAISADERDAVWVMLN